MTYAIFKASGQQFKASVGDTLRVPLLEKEPGSRVTFDEVLLASDGKKIATGKPSVKGAKVTAEVVRHGKGEKLVVFKFKRRKNYRRKNGHRQQYTEIKVTDLKF